MKTTLFTLLSAGLIGYAGAQNIVPLTSQARNTPVTVTNVIAQRALPKEPKSSGLSNKSATNVKSALASPRKTHKIQSSGGSAIYIGGSDNLNCVRYPGTTQLTYNQALNLIVSTHRYNFSQCGDSVNLDGAYEASYSINGGRKWDSTLTLYHGQTTRYPNGVISNPNGNQDLSAAVWAVNGPLTSNNTKDSYVGWDSIAFGSCLFDSSAVTQQYLVNGSPGVLMQDGDAGSGAILYMSSSNNGTVHSIGEGEYWNKAGNGFTWTGAVLNTGKWNPATQNFKWTQTLFRPHLLNGGQIAKGFDTNAQINGDPGTAWSQDGKTGYVVIFGNLDSIDAKSGQNLNFVTYQPLVWKTTDSGNSWTMLTPHNFINDPVMSQYLRVTNDSVNTVLPVWHNFSFSFGSIDAMDPYDLTVDKYGNLHIFGAVMASAIASPDSSFYISAFPNYTIIFDVSTTASNTFATRYIDTLFTQPLVNASINGTVWASDPASSVGSIGFGHRIQASRTTDGSKVFCTWVDDITGAQLDSLEYPDIFGQGYDVTNNTATSVESFTYNNPLLLNANFYTFSSDIVMQNGATYIIPTTELVPPGSSYNGTTGCEYQYLDSVVVFNNNMFVGIPPINAHSGISVSPNYPNPFNKTTQFTVWLDKESPVTTDVYNLLGEKIASSSTRSMSPGSHVITINGSTFSSGVYFYRVTAEGSTVTHKMVVTK